MIKENKLYYPKANGEDAGADMTRIFIAESRLPELAILNSEKAPELDAIMLQAYIDSNSLLSAIELELNRVKSLLERRSSLILVDNINEILESKKLKDNADTRKAIVALDTEYQKLQDKQDALEAFHTHIKGKVMAFAMAHASVSSISERKNYYTGVHYKEER